MFFFSFKYSQGSGRKAAFTLGYALVAPTALSIIVSRAIVKT
jgi:hypothetical protein